MKRFLVLLVGIGLCGCATFYSIRNYNKGNLAKLSVGMAKDEAMSIMGNKTVMACPSTMFNILTFGFGLAQCADIKNPYRTETLQGNDKTFEVLYYYTDAKRLDDKISDEELTPLVFDGGRLAGMGWDFLQNSIGIEQDQ